MSPRKQTLLFGLAIVALLLPARRAAAIGEQDGRISGTVVEKETGAPIPGATITATSPALIGNARRITSDESGAFELIGLQPGKYTVEFTYPGLHPITRKVVVDQGRTTPVEVLWTPELTQVETTVVEEERHMTRPDSTQTGTVLSADTQSRVATNRSYQGIMLQVAGVRDINGGGNPQVKGGLLTHNRYLVDGLDITDPVTNTFSSNINFDSIAATEVITGGFEAQYNSLGAVSNLITVAGSDKLHIDASFYLQNAALAVTEQYGSNLYNGVRPNATVPAGPTSTYLGNLNVSGPILKHRLWYAASFQFTDTESSIPAGPPFPDIQHPSRKFIGYLFRLKLTWAPNDKHRVTLSASANPATIDNTAQSNGTTPAAERRQGQGGVFAIAQWDYFVSQHLNTNVQLGFQYNHIDSGPQAAYGSYNAADWMGKFSDAANAYQRDRPQHTVIDAAGNTVWYNSLSDSKDSRYTLQFDPSVSFRGKLAGYHEAKIGIQTRLITHQQDYQYNGGVAYTDTGGGFGEAGICDETTGNGCFQRTSTTPFTSHQWGFSSGIFLQDRWRPIKRLTIMPGIRLDYGLSKNTLGETVSSFFGVGPRLGANFDITGDQRTIISVSYGRSNEVLTLLSAANADTSAVFRTERWNQDTKAWDLYQESGGPGGYKLAPNNFTPPHSDEILVSLRREFAKNSMASLEYTWKRISNIWDGVEINQIWDPTGYRVVGYNDGSPHTISYYTTPSENYRIYQGIDAAVESRPTPNIDIYAAYTLSWLYGPGAEEFGQINDATQSQFFNPRQSKFYDGFLAEDVRHQLKLRMSYSLHGFTAGFFTTFTTGSPLTKLFYNNGTGAQNNYRAPQGTDPGTTPNNPIAFSELRTPDALTFDLRVQYSFYELIHQNISLMVDVFNLFNIRPASVLSTTDDTLYGTVASRYRPLRVQLGLRYEF